jgi:hypothetical protein
MSGRYSKVSGIFNYWCPSAAAGVPHASCPSSKLSASDYPGIHTDGIYILVQVHVRCALICIQRCVYIYTPVPSGISTAWVNTLHSVRTYILDIPTRTWTEACVNTLDHSRQASCIWRMFTCVSAELIKPLLMRACPSHVDSAVLYRRKWHISEPGVELQ